MKRCLQLAALTLCVLLCAGCTSRGGAGDLLPILSAGISAQPDGSLQLTAEAVRQNSLEGDAASLYLTASGNNPDALFAGAEQLLAGKLYLSHARTVVIDASIAEQGIGPLVRALLARSDVRLTLRLAVARDVTADEIVRAQAVVEDIPGEALGSLLDGHTARGELPDLPLCRVADRILSGGDFSLPAVTLTGDGRVIPAGQADFRLARMTGFSGGDSDAG